MKILTASIAEQPYERTSAVVRETRVSRYNKYSMLKSKKQRESWCIEDSFMKEVFDASSKLKQSRQIFEKTDFDLVVTALAGFPSQTQPL